MGRIAPPKPRAERRRRNVPVRGEWQPTPGVGWQHGPIPDPPANLRPVVHAIWQTWMKSWWASHWLPEDLPGLALVIALYDECQSYFEDPFVEKSTRKGDSMFVLKPNPVSELRQMMDNYGITPKGQQDRRWMPPKADEMPRPNPVVTPGGQYGALKVVGE